MRQRLAWTRAAATAGQDGIREPPFTPEEFPEAIGSLLALSHINQFSHVVMDGSPVTAPFGLNGIKAAALRIFGSELKVTTERRI